MPFDPTQPFEPVEETPSFDPSQPYEPVAVAEFDPAQPFEAVEEAMPSIAPTSSRLADAAARIPSEIAQMAAKTAQGLVKIGSYTPPGLLVRGLEAAKSAITGEPSTRAADTQQFMRDVQERAASDYGVDPLRDKDVVSKVISGVGSLLPVVAAGPAAPVAAAGLMAESAQQDAEAHGATPAQQGAAFALGGVTGIVSEFLLGVPALIRSAKASGLADDAVKSLMRPIVSQAFKSAGREAAQESIEQISGNLIANTLVGYDPTRPTLEGVPEAALLGAAVGGPVGGVVQAAASIDARRAEPATVAPESLAPPDFGPVTPAPSEAPPAPSGEQEAATVARTADQTERYTAVLEKQGVPRELFPFLSEEERYSLNQLPPNSEAHQALLAKHLETARKRQQQPTGEPTNAPQERQQPESDQPQYPRDAARRTPAETGRGGSDVAGQEAQAQKVGPQPFTSQALQAPAAKRLGITAQPSFKEPTALKRALTTAVGWLRPRGHHPEEQYARLQVRDSEIAAGDRVIAYASRDLMKALKEQYGLSKIEILGGGTKRIPVADVQWMTRYLKGDPVAQNFVPPAIRGPLDTMRAAIDNKSRQVIDRLIADQRALPPGGPQWQRIQDTIDTVRGNMDVYVHRAYKFFDSKEPAPDWYDRLPPGVRQNAETYIAGSAPVPLTPSEARSRILDWLSDLKGQQVGSGKVGSKDPSIMMHKHLSSPELRAVLGEYGSPMELFAKSMGKMTKWVANHRFLNDVKVMGMGRWLFEEGTNPPGFNARIAAEGSENMSPLNGLRTTHEIAQAFEHMSSNEVSWPIIRWYYAMVAQSKFAATAQSLMTQSRNLLGRPMMALMAGHWNPKHVGTAAKAIWADIAGNNKRWQAFTKEAYDYGVLGDTAHGAEMQAILKDAALQDVDPAALYSWSLTRAAKQIGWKIPGDFYRASDDMGNLVGWLNEIESQRAIHPTLSDAQIKAKAASIVRDIYPTYSETPAVVQAFRKVPLTGAFVTFPYQTVRTAYNSMMRGMLEVRSTNAAERTVGAKRLAGIAVVLSSPFILQELSKLVTGLDSEREDDYRAYQPSWSRNSKFAFLDQDAATGEITAINLSYLDPYSYMTDPIMSAISSMRTDEPLDSAIARATHEFFRPWIDEQMVTRAIIDSARNKTATGREIFNETDSAYEKATAISRHIGEALTPGTIKRTTKRIIPALKGEQTAYGGKLEPITEVSREISGIALEKFNFKNGLAAKVKPFREMVDSSEDVFRRAATQVATTSPKQIVEAYRTSEERRQTQYRQMRGFYLAAIRQGVDPEEAEDILESRGMSNRDIRNVAAGRYEPLKITPAIRERAANIDRKLPEAEIRAIQAEAEKVSID